MSAKKVLFAGVVIIALLAAACDDAGFSVDPLLPQSIAIDPTFREFYDLLGGEETLGPGISPIFEHRNVYYQYTVAALMVHGQARLPASAFLPLGLDTGTAKRPSPLQHCLNSAMSMGTSSIACSCRSMRN
jgi:hypothetical protein